MHIANVNGCGLHYTDQGPKDGPAVVFSNSLGTDLRLWDAMLPHLPDGLRLVRYDKRGHGLSQMSPAPVTIDMLADDAAALIRHLGLRDVVFVGLSIGGLIGQALSARHGDLLRALVLSNTAARIGSNAVWTPRIQAIEAGGMAAIGAPTMERWFSAQFRAAPECALWQAMLERQPAQGYIALARAIAAADYRDAAPRLNLPVLAIAGAQDGATPPDLVRATADMIPRARCDVIDGVGHLPCVEAPATYAGLLSAFLREVGHV